jgi:hypothetical protein
MIKELACTICLIGWLIFGLAIWWGLSTGDRARDKKTMAFWQAYDSKMREVLRTPIESPKYEKLAQELYGMHPPSEEPSIK